MIQKSGLKETLVLQTLYDAEIQGKMFPSTAMLLWEASARLRKSEGHGKVGFYTVARLEQKGMLVKQGALNAHKRPSVLTDAGRKAAMAMCAQPLSSFDEADHAGYNKPDPLPEESASPEDEPSHGFADYPMPSNAQPSSIENTAMIDAVLAAFMVAAERFTRLAEAMEKLIVRFDVMLGEQTSRAQVRQQLEHALEGIHRENKPVAGWMGGNGLNMQD